MLSGDNGILQKATDAKQTTEKSEAKEQAQLDILAWISDKTSKNENSALNDSIVQGILDEKSYVKEAKATSFITAKGEYEIPYSELYIASDTPQTVTLPAGTYTAGQEVTFGDEQFFVIGDDGNTVRLLAKYCLNQEGTSQTDKNATSSGNNNTERYGRQFSQTNYWLDNITNRGTPFDLQSEEMIEEARGDGTTIQNAVLTAIAYGEAKGVTGRLMTYSEGVAMKSSNSAILFGNWSDGTHPTEGYLLYWLGTTSVTEQGDSGTNVYVAHGMYQDCGNVRSPYNATVLRSTPSFDSSRRLKIYN